MNMKFQDGLLFTSIQISFRGRTKVIENIVIDTGAANQQFGTEFLFHHGEMAIQFMAQSRWGD